MEGGHPVRLSTANSRKNEGATGLSVLRTLADKMSALHHRSRY
jgi:hypothetical protein